MSDVNIKKVIEEAKLMVEDLYDRAYVQEEEARDDYGCYDECMEEASRYRNQADVLWTLISFAEDNLNKED